MKNDSLILAKIAFQLSGIAYSSLSRAEKNIIDLLLPTGFIEIDENKETNLLPAATRVMRGISK